MELIAIYINFKPLKKWVKINKIKRLISRNNLNEVEKNKRREGIPFIRPLTDAVLAKAWNRATNRSMIECWLCSVFLYFQKESYLANLLLESTNLLYVTREL